MPISQQELARRLKVSRQTCGLTQQQVADRLALPRTALTQIELGKRAVSSVELQQLAEFYGRDLAELLAEDFEQEPVEALFRTHRDLADRSVLHQAVRSCVQLGRDLAELEERLDRARDSDSLPSYQLDCPRTKWEAVEQGARIAREERQRLGLGDAPILGLSDLLDSQGIQLALLSLPDDVSGLTLSLPKMDILVAINANHSHERRRFSAAHEYAHALLDRNLEGTISRECNRTDLSEVRANSFAACFLMPGDGLKAQARALGKGYSGRRRVEIYDEIGPISAESRSDAESREWQLYDIVRLAHHFRTSRQTTLYRLLNLKLIPKADLDRLSALEARHGKRTAAFLGLAATPAELEGAEFRNRFLALALEAWRREAITYAKLLGLAQQVGIEQAEIEQLIEDLGLPSESGEDAPMHPVF